MPSLLVVEDNAILAATLAKFLDRTGNMSVAAIVPSAEAALEELRHITVDLVLVDVALPGMSGIDLVATLRARHPKLPCLMLSGHNEVEYIRRALAAGARGCVRREGALSAEAQVSVAAR